MRRLNGTAAQLVRRAAQGRHAPAAAPDFQRLFEGAAGAILVLAPDRDFTILAVSDRFLGEVLREREAIVGRGMFDLFPDDAGDGNPAGGGLRASLERILAGSPSEVMAVRKRDLDPGREDGKREERYLRPTNHAVRSAAGVLLCLVHQVEDVTDLIRAEAKSAALDAALEQANRELDSLCYSISHDLKAPLRAIDGFSHILEEEHSDRLDSEGKRVLSVIREGGAKMGHMIEDVLAYSRLGRRPLSVTTVDMSAVAQAAFEEARAAAPGAPELNLGPLPRVEADAALMEQVWLNLLANAVKFSSARSPAVIEVSAVERGEETVYSVRDNGVGFDMRYCEKLFGLFQRLHPEHEFPGSGVGLAVVQRLIARHGGRVWAESAPSAGATFYFSLPKSGEHA